MCTVGKVGRFVSGGMERVGYIGNALSFCLRFSISKRILSFSIPIIQPNAADVIIMKMVYSFFRFFMCIGWRPNNSMFRSNITSMWGVSFFLISTETLFRFPLYDIPPLPLMLTPMF